VVGRPGAQLRHPADFVRGRYGSRGLALAVAVTGILATMPYIALQLVGIQALLTVMGVGTNASNGFIKDLPLIIAFLLLAAFTYLSGLRAPALIAFIKDALVYLMIIVAVIYIPSKLGGWGTSSTQQARTWPRPTPRPASHSGRSRSHPRANGPTPRWPWARRWRCSCTRTP
jgi:solute:Na+ symporter, SSS family